MPDLFISSVSDLLQFSDEIVDHQSFFELVLVIIQIDVKFAPPGGDEPLHALLRKPQKVVSSVHWMT